MGRKFPGIYQHDDGRWWVDKVVAGRRLRKAFGADYAEAEEWLLGQLTRIRAARGGERPRFVFEKLPVDTSKSAKATDLEDARLPKPMIWAQQRILLPQLSDHAAQMALFGLNSGARDATVCSLRWEVLSPDLPYSIFVVPKDTHAPHLSRKASCSRQR